MIGVSKLKAAVVGIVFVLGVVFSAPTFMPKEAFNELPAKAKEWLNPITLGLDLQGGSYLLMEVNTNELVKEKLTSLSELVRTVLRENDVKFSIAPVTEEVLVVRVLNTADTIEARDLIRKQENTQLDIEISGTALNVRYSPEAIEKMIQQATAQSVDIVRNRLDQLGTTEPLIQQQGTNRIVVQMPGVQDPSEVKSLLGKTAKMSFHLADEEVSVLDAQMGKIPVTDMLIDGTVLKRAPVVSGADLDDAQKAYGENNEPVVSFSFKPAGAKKFAKATRENVGRQLAIVLDGKIISAPVINGPIPGGKGQITGNFTVESANDLALLLRSGALPAPLQVVEERVVGPGLGEDSIKAGTTACVVGLLLVFGCMLFVYGFTFGTIANIVLVVNGILLLALLNLLNATLTLPGIAGIALTIAMAVDANVLIYERMKEEMAHGITHPVEVVKRGFSGSFSAILDGQLTTLFAAFFLFWLGSGPVRGFGVTLGLGLATSMFSALWVTKVLLSLWMGWRKPKKIDL